MAIKKPHIIKKNKGLKYPKNKVKSNKKAPLK